MNRVPLALAALLAGLAGCLAVGSFVAAVVPAPLAAAAAPEEKTERVIQLPEDGDYWQLVLVCEKRQPSWLDRQLRAAFETSPRLRSLREQTQFYDYAPDSPWIRANLPSSHAPLVRLQSATGRRVYQAEGSAIPADPESLADALERAVADCVDGRCPDRRPLDPLDHQRPPKFDRRPEEELWPLLAGGLCLLAFVTLLALFAGAALVLAFAPTSPRVQP